MYNLFDFRCLILFLLRCVYYVYDALTRKDLNENQMSLRTKLIKGTTNILQTNVFLKCGR